MLTYFDLQMTNGLYQRTLEVINAAAGSMNEEQLLYCRDEKWSTAMILEHLDLAFSGTVFMMEKALAKDRPLGGKPTLKQRAAVFVVVTVGYFPPGRPSPKQVVPTGKLSGSESLQLVQNSIKRMEELHHSCLERFGKDAYLGNHPVLGPLKTYQWPKFHFTHTLHHAKQIENLKRLCHAGTQAA